MHCGPLNLHPYLTILSLFPHIVRPIFTDTLAIKQGRHPIMEVCTVEARMPARFRIGGAQAPLVHL